MALGIEFLRKWAREIKREVVALWIAARDPRTPVIAKAVASVVVAYALSPIDLIPDFIPILGYADDLILVPLGIALAISLIPKALMAEYRTLAVQRPDSRASYLAAGIIITIWAGSAYFVIRGLL